jgi:hypothetical protein
LYCQDITWDETGLQGRTDIQHQGYCLGIGCLLVTYASHKES